MNNHTSRLTRIEKKLSPRAPVIYDVQLVDEITPAMRRAQQEAYARGEQYFIIEPEENEGDKHDENKITQ